MFLIFFQSILAVICSGRNLEYGIGGFYLTDYIIQEHRFVLNYHDYLILCRISIQFLPYPYWSADSYYRSPPGLFLISKIISSP